MTELTEKLNSLIKKEHRRRSDSFKVRGFVDDDDQIGHLLAKYYDLEASEGELIVPVVQKKQICAKVEADIKSKMEAKSKQEEEMTNELNLLVKNIENNLRKMFYHHSAKCIIWFRLHLVHDVSNIKRDKVICRKI